MPILETFEAKIPKENANAPGGTITRRVAYAGFAIDKRTFTNADMQTFYNSTKKFAVDQSSLVKVKIGHRQEGTPFTKGEQELKGFVKSLELRSSTPESSDRLELWANMHLYPEVKAAMDEGRYPESSIGALSIIKDSEGNDIEGVIEHIALLGAERAAMPENDESRFKALTQTLYSSLKDLFIADKNQQKEVETMAAENLNDKTEPETQVAEPEKKVEEPVIDATPQVPELKYTSQEASLCFNSLVEAGNLSPDRRVEFDSLLDKVTDLDFVKNFFSKSQAKTPPNGEKTKSNRDESHILAEAKEFRAIGKALDLSKDETEAYIKAIAEEEAENAPSS